MIVLIYTVLLVLAIDSMLGATIPEDVRIYYQDEADMPFVGNIVLWCYWKNIL